MPRQVIESAEKTLKSLEDGTVRNLVVSSDRQSGPSRMTKAHNVKEGRVESDGSLQLSFFQLDDPLLSALRDDLANVDINNLTPLQAFDLLRSMKEKLGI